MRITDLYDLKKREEKRNKLKESLMSDIESLAECQFKGNEFERFMIRIKLEKIRR